MKNLITKEEKDQIYLICEEFNIVKYSINPDGSIDVDGNVELSYSGLVKIPLNFNKVSGLFRCDSNDLKSLEGCPKIVGGDFDCEGNFLTSLEGCPNSVGGYFDASHNDLISTFSGNTDIDYISDAVTLYENYLPQLLLDNLEHIKLILKYQRHFFIWNDDLTLNEENFNILILEIKDGLQ